MSRRSGSRGSNRDGLSPYLFLFLCRGDEGENRIDDDRRNCCSNPGQTWLLKCDEGKTREFDVKRWGERQQVERTLMSKGPLLFVCAYTRGPRLDMTVPPVTKRDAKSLVRTRTADDVVC